MSESHPARIQSHVTGSSREPDPMAEALVSPIPAHLTQSFAQRHRTFQPLRLPPLTIPPSSPTPPSPQVDRRDLESSVPFRLPPVHSIASRTVEPPISNPGWSRRRDHGPAAPLADLLSPQPGTSTKPKAESPLSYVPRRTPSRSYTEAPFSARPGVGSHTELTSPSSVVATDTSYPSPLGDPFRPQQTTGTSPRWTPPFESAPVHRMSHGKQPRSIEFAAPAALRTEARDVPRPPAEKAFWSSSQTDIVESKLDFELYIRQQPVAARACGFGERDRRVIDPPPIVQLVARNPQTGIVALDEVSYSLYVIHCTLWSADGQSEQTTLQQPERRAARRLMGQLVASASVAKDENDEEGCFFCFPDLSCRTHGQYRLRFVLIRLDPSELRVGAYSPILTDVYSDVLSVYTAKDFPGMRPSSALTRALKLQGCNIQVKKGSERAMARKRQASDGIDGADEAERIRRWKGSAYEP